MLNGIGNVELVGSIKIGSTEYTADQLNSQLNKNTTPIGTIFYHISSVPPEGAFLLNGQVIYNCSTLYPEFYQYVTSNNGIRKITSSVYESELTSVGICGGFVVDSENGSIRLPNISNGFIEGSNGSNIGNTIDAGLPNITGDSQIYFKSGNSQTNPINYQYGSFIITDAIKAGAANGEVTYAARLGFNASYSNPIYGNSNTVQPKSVCYSVCIQVFNTTTSLSNQESTQLASEMQGKAGVNADNFTSIGKDKIIDNTFELDWENITELQSLNTFYLSNKAGILYGTFNNTSSNSVNCYTIVSYIDAWSSAEINGRSFSNGFSVPASSFITVHSIVPKGCYYAFRTSNSISGASRFIPFKNSISANNN